MFKLGTSDPPTPSAIFRLKKKIENTLYFFEDFSPGKYKVKIECDSTQAVSFYSNTLRTFKIGEFMDIVEVKSFKSGDTIRGRLDTIPESWITMQDKDYGFVRILVERVRVNKPLYFAF